MMISVIVPVYKVEPYLNQCVESILCQTYTDLEVLLIDDGSPDSCGQICDEYGKQDCRVKVFHTENRGLSAARNLGIEKSQGDFVAFVDSDDWIEPEMCEVVLRRIHETKADIIMFGYYVISDKNTEERKLIETVCDREAALVSLINGKINNAVWNKLYRKKVLQSSEVDGVVFPEGKNHEDFAVMHRIVEKTKSIALISETLYHYRIRLGSISRIYSARNLIDYADSRLSRYLFFQEECPELYEENKEELLLLAAKGISKVWRWWHGCKVEEKRKYHIRIKELQAFIKDNIPIFSYPAWPISLRFSIVFMHSSSSLTFAVLYAINQLFRKITG